MEEPVPNMIRLDQRGDQQGQLKAIHAGKQHRIIERGSGNAQNENGKSQALQKEVYLENRLTGRLGK